MYHRLYEHRFLILLLLLVITGTVIRTAPVRTGQHFWDETVYLQHAGILTGHHIDNYNEFDFRPPLISLILAGIFAIFPSPTAAHIVVSLLAVLGTPIVYLLGRELYGRRAGILAALMFTVSPVHILESHKLHIDPVLPTIWLLAAFSGFCMLQDGKKRYAVLAGVFTGAAVLAKFTSLVLVPLLGLLLFLDRAERQDWNLSLAGTASIVSALVRDRRTWLYGTGVMGSLLPYLVWSQVTYGHPLHPFLRGLLLSGAEQPFLTYITGFHELVAAPFLLGLLLFLPALRQLDDRRIYYPVLFVLVLFIPLQFMIANKEVRYLLPVVPFLAIMAGHGLARIQLDGRQITVLTGILLLATPLFLPPAVGDSLDAVVAGRTTTHEPYTPTYDAAVWLRNNTERDALLYTNYEWPILAYYSHRPIQLMPVGRPFQDAVSRYMKEPGYVFYTDRAPDHYDPSLSFLHQDPRFQDVETFGDGTYLFYYDPRRVE